MSIFKEPLAGEVANQLAARQHLISKENRSSTDLAYLNSKAAWVQLRSSVDIVVPEGNSSNLAIGNVLANGTLGAFNYMKRGVGDYKTSAYSHQTYNASTKSTENNVMGIRPMPGITNMSIQNKGAYGSLRQATVTFQCWDIKQLDILEQLYMRPGYTVLLEWGWNPYIDNNGKLVNLQNQDNKFFTRKDIQLQDYLSDLRKRSLDSHGNYDSMFGYIMNYSWKYRGDGGYDCTTEIISTGELLESYKINFSGAPVISKDPNTATKLFSGISYSDSTNIKTEYAKNVLTGIIYETYTACKTQFESTGGQTMGIGSFEYDYKDKKGVVSYAVSNVAVEIPGTVTNEDGTEAVPTDTSETSGNVLDPGKDIYITLESFVGLINNFILLQNPSDKVNKRIMNLSVNDRPDVGKADQPLYCLTHPLQISVDPSVCIIRNDAFVNNIKKIKITTSSTVTEVNSSIRPLVAKPNQTPTIKGQFGVESIIAKSEVSTIQSNINKAANLTSSEGYLKFCGLLRPFYKNLFNKELGEHSEIYLNLRMLYNLALDSTLKSQDPAEKDGIQLIPYVKNILTTVQNATGNVNNFEIIIDGQSGYIVDLNYINLGDVTPFTFNISGRNSILRDIQFESQIFADQASIIAISAQSDAGKLGLENSSMVAFNNGIRDRMISKKDSPISSQKDPTEQLVGFVTALADIKIFFDAWNNLTDAKIKYEQVNAFKTSLTEVISFATTIYKSSSNKYKSILPTKVSLTFDGIGGLIIGNIFNIDKAFTPSSYKGDGSGIDLQYIITNIKQDIGTDNQWKTTIQGNPFIPDSSSKNLDNNLTSLDTAGFEINLSVEYDQATGQIIKRVSTSKIPSSFGKLDTSGDYKNVTSNYIAYRESYQSNAYYDVTRYRGGFGTENKVLANGQVVKVTQNTTFTAEEAKRTLQYDIDKVFVPKIQDKIGKSNWNALKPTQQAALISYAYNTGNINDEMAKNIKSKNFTAVANLLSNGINTSKGKFVEGLAVRRQEEAALFSK
jgi:GH24 family phage-related lysozyme (muramidase)